VKHPADEASGKASGTSGCDDTVDMQMSGELAALLAERDQDGGPVRDSRGDGLEHLAYGTDLLDSVRHWPVSRTPVGSMRLVPVSMNRDLRLITAWMNDPAVAAFWELPGPEEVTAAHLRGQLEGDGRSVPCLGVLDDVPMSYWEIYRADLDPIARHCQVRPHDTGLHLLIGGVPDRGRGIGAALLRAVADLVLDRRPSCGRVLAEPDVRNVPSVAAFLSAGFRLSAEVDLPGKRAALMIRDREFREVL
jgi:RimJ/RimL family protein N-acetyltransferase